jgi:hypothetical protein
MANARHKVLLLAALKFGRGLLLGPRKDRSRGQCGTVTCRYGETHHDIIHSVIPSGIHSLIHSPLGKPVDLPGRSVSRITLRRATRHATREVAFQALPWPPE